MENLKKMAIAMTAVYASAVENDRFYSKEKRRVSPNYRNYIPKPAHQREILFNIKGVQISAYSRKDAIKKYARRFGKK